jgi:hypothetical protein
MAHRVPAFIVTVTLGLLVSQVAVRAAPTEVAPVDDTQARTLRLVTGYHSIRHKRSRLEVRFLEVDGSASVAQDPIALFLVVTNNLTSDLKEHLWRLPRGVARVRSLYETTCGVDVDVDVDGPGEPTPKPVLRVLHLCFLSKDGELASTLQFSDDAASAPANKPLQRTDLPPEKRTRIKLR